MNRTSTLLTLFLSSAKVSNASLFPWANLKRWFLCILMIFSTIHLSAAQKGSKHFYMAKVQLKSGLAYLGFFYKMDQEGIYITQSTDFKKRYLKLLRKGNIALAEEELFFLPFGDIKILEIRKRVNFGRGFFNGFWLGVAFRLFAGIVSDSTDIDFLFKDSDFAFLSYPLLFGTLGGISVGSRQKFDFKHPLTPLQMNKLMRYPIVPF